MDYRHLGRSGMLVSALSYGNWITHGSQIEEDAALACVKASLDAGITTFDTADVYAIGQAESVLGRALKGVRRDSIEIFTKVYWPTGPNPNNRGLSRKHIIESLHASLERLQTDHVDLLQAHRYDYATPLEETLRAFDDLVRQGKVHYIGVSEWTAAQIADALRLADDMGFDRIISNQPQYSMLWRVIEAEVVPLSVAEGVSQIVWSPLAQGVLTGKYLPGAAPLADSRATGVEGEEMSWLLRDDVLGPVQEYAALCRDAGLGAAEREREQRHPRGQPARADRRERQGPRHRPRTGLRGGHREGPGTDHAVRPRFHVQPERAALRGCAPAPGPRPRERCLVARRPET
jgi:aryl-alcohol dehydrogenase-like predicted oxidoreductase